MDSIIRFRRSYAVLQKFYERWIVRIGERCQDQDQRLAAYYVWSRYSMSMLTIDSMLNPQLIPDFSVICRGCIEFDVSLEAVLKDPNVALAYLEFEKHAKAKYLKLLSRQGDIERLLLRRKQFDDEFGEDPDDFRLSSWCARYQGITGLIQRLERHTDMRMYNILSHYAHGSVAAVQALERNTTDPNRLLENLLEATYSSFLKSSVAFVSFIWEPLMTPEGERCTQDFCEVVTAHISSAGN